MVGQVIHQQYFLFRSGHFSSSTSKKLNLQSKYNTLVASSSQCKLTKNHKPTKHWPLLRLKEAKLNDNVRITFPEKSIFQRFGNPKYKVTKSYGLFACKKSLKTVKSLGPQRVKQESLCSGTLLTRPPLGHKIHVIITRW